MHEILLYGLPAAGGAAYSARLWWMSRLRRRWTFGPLPAADGKRYGSQDVRDAKATVVVFMTNRCPGVKAYDARLRRLHAQWSPGVAFVGINAASEALYPDESLQGMASAQRQRRIPFPYLKDEGQRTAKHFGAVCTPEVFVLDHRGRIRYHGRIDDSIVERDARRHYLADALERVARGRRLRRPRPAWTPPLGCVIEFA